VHTLSKVLSPAAQAFRYFMLERGEAYLATQYARHLPLRGNVEPKPARRAPARLRA